MGKGKLEYLEFPSDHETRLKRKEVRCRVKILTLVSTSSNGTAHQGSACISLKKASGSSSSPCTEALSDAQATCTTSRAPGSAACSACRCSVNCSPPAQGKYSPRSGAGRRAWTVGRGGSVTPQRSKRGPQRRSCHSITIRKFL